MRISNPKTHIKDKVSSGRPLLGMGISSMDPAITDIVGAAGFDFVMIDHEHGPMGPESAQHHVRAAEAFGMIPIARVGELSTNLIGKFLDIGCQGIIIPHIDTADQAKRVVEATRFSPNGSRGMCPASHAAGYRGGDTTPFVRSAESETLVGVIVESEISVRNAYEIAAVDGIDFILFGAGDLSSELGVIAEGWSSPLIISSWNRVVDACKTAGKLVMAMTLADSSRESIQAKREEGADLVIVYHDLLLIQRMFSEFVVASSDEKIR